MIKKIVIRCPHCTSKLVYFRKKTMDWFCRTCGRTFKEEEIKKDG